MFLAALNSQTDFGLCGCTQRGEAAQMSHSPGSYCCLLTAHFAQHSSHRTVIICLIFAGQSVLFSTPIPPNTQASNILVLVKVLKECCLFNRWMSLNIFFQEASMLSFSASP